MKSWIKNYEFWWMKPVDGMPLAVFRILFGIFVVLDALYFLSFQKHYWPEQNFYFHFPAFVFWPHFNFQINSCLIATAGLAGVFIAIGLKIRWASAWVTLIITHLLLIEATFYLNHLVIVWIVSFIFIFVPTDRFLAMQKSQASSGPPRDIARFEWVAVIAPFWMSYFYSAIEKMREEWVDGSIIAANTGMGRNINPIANWLYRSHYSSAQAWSVLIVELLAPFFLIFRKTRRVTILGLFIFHVICHFTLDIGLFSLLMISSLILYW